MEVAGVGQFLTVMTQEPGALRKAGVPPIRPTGISGPVPVDVAKGLNGGVGMDEVKKRAEPARPTGWSRVNADLARGGLTNHDREGATRRLLQKRASHGVGEVLFQEKVDGPPIDHVIAGIEGVVEAG